MPIQQEQTNLTNNHDQFLIQIAALPETFLEITLRENNNYESAVALLELVSSGNLDEWLIERTKDENLNQAEILEISTRIKNVLFKLEKERFFGSESTPSTEQSLKPHLETLKSNYSEELLRSRFAEKGFDLEKYIFEVLHTEIVVISELAGDKNRMTDGFIYAEGNLDVLKRALREVKMENSYNIYSIFEIAGQINIESIPDEFCEDIILKTLALEELKPIIESEYKKQRINAKQIHLGIKESKVAELSQKVGDEIAALKIARRELTRSINSGESVQNRLTAVAANIKSERVEYSDLEPKETTQSITIIQPAKQISADPKALAEVAKRLLAQRESDQVAKIIKITKDVTQDPYTAAEQSVSQIDSLQVHQELSKAERQAEDLIIKGFELRIANYETEKEIIKLRMVNKELIKMMTDHTIQIPSNLNSLLGKINKFKDGNQAAMILPRLRKILIEKAYVLGIDFNVVVTNSINSIESFQNFEDFNFPNNVILGPKMNELFEEFVQNPIHSKLLSKIKTLALSFDQYFTSREIPNLSNYYRFVTKGDFFSPKNISIYIDTTDPDYEPFGLKRFVEYRLDKEKRIYIRLNKEGNYELIFTNENFKGIH
jgi:hypothetical protein